jgi:hypothetical protein
MKLIPVLLPQEAIDRQINKDQSLRIIMLLNITALSGVCKAEGNVL